MITICVGMNAAAAKLYPIPNGLWSGEANHGRVGPAARGGAYSIDQASRKSNDGTDFRERGPAFVGYLRFRTERLLFFSTRY